MKIIDCFLFNGEIDILSLRLRVMGPYIDRFLIVESDETFSGQQRELVFPKLKDRFKEYQHKIDYKPICNIPSFTVAWDREHYIRDQIRLLVNANDEDILIIADVDEILNMPEVLKALPLPGPMIIEVPSYYSFLNLCSNEIMKLSLISPYKSIRNTFSGNRNLYKNFVAGILKNEDRNYGWHFTYQFGYEIDKYVEKIKNFSHQEFNNPYFLDHNRIKKCLDYHLDILERWSYKYRIVDLKKRFPFLFEAIKSNENLSALIKKRNFKNVFFLLLRFFDPFYLKRKKIPIMIFISKIKKKILVIFGRK